MNIRSILDKLDYLAEDISPRNGEWLGDNIGKIQQGLKDLNFDPGAIDSNFGPNTAAAVRAFQQANGLKVDGDPGPDTVKVMNQLLSKGGASGSAASASSAQQQDNGDAAKLDKLAADLEKVAITYADKVSPLSAAALKVAGTSVGKVAGPLAAAKTAASVAGKVGMKALGGGLSLAAFTSNIMDAYKSYEKGEYTDAAISGGAAATNLVPGWTGAALSAGTSGYQAWRDSQKAAKPATNESMRSLQNRLLLIEQTAINESIRNRKILENRRIDEDLKDWANQLGLAGLVAKFGKKANRVIACVQMSWDAYKQIIAEPKPDENDPKAVATYRSKISKIIGAVVSKFGLFYAGSAIGAMIGGVAGSPGGFLSIATSLLGGVGGGIAAEAIWGDDAEAFVNWAVDQIYPEGAKSEDPAVTADTASTEVQPDDTTKSATSDSDVQPDDAEEDDEDEDDEDEDDEDDESSTIGGVTPQDSEDAVSLLQSALARAGLDINISGKFGDDTVAAIQSFKDSIGAATDADAIAKLLNIPLTQKNTVKESIDYNKLSDVDKMSYLVSKISLLESYSRIDEGPFDGLGRNIAKNIPGTTSNAKNIANTVLGKIPMYKNELGQSVALRGANGSKFKRLPPPNDHSYSDGSVTLSARQVQKRLAKAEQNAASQAAIAVQPGATFTVPKAPGRPEQTYTKDKDGVWKYQDASGKKMKVKKGSNTEREIEDAAKAQMSAAAKGRGGNRPTANASGSATNKTSPPIKPGSTAAGAAGAASKTSLPRRLAGLVFNKKFLALNAALLALGYSFENGNLKSIAAKIMGLLPGGDSDKTDKDANANANVPPELLALAKQIKDLIKAHGPDTNPAWVAAKKRAEAILTKLGIPLDPEPAAPAVAAPKPVPAPAQVKPQAAEPVAQPQDAQQAPIQTTITRAQVDNGPWPPGSPQAAAYSKLSPQMKQHIGGADPTDNHIISAMADGSGWGRAKGINDANPDGSPKSGGPQQPPAQPVKNKLNALPGAIYNGGA